MSVDDVIACVVCERWFPHAHSRGPVPRYCSQSCRQRAYRERTVKGETFQAETRARLTRLEAKLDALVESLRRTERTGRDNL
jgi:hypothetical protein